ncbi:uncharacterized protein LOC135121817 isoform X2 [Zophobas morio]
MLISSEPGADSLAIFPRIKNLPVSQFYDTNTPISVGHKEVAHQNFAEIYNDSIDPQGCCYLACYYGNYIPPASYSLHFQMHYQLETNNSSALFTCQKEFTVIFRTPFEFSAELRREGSFSPLNCLYTFVPSFMMYQVTCRTSFPVCVKGISFNTNDGFTINTSCIEEDILFQPDDIYSNGVGTTYSGNPTKTSLGICKISWKKSVFRPLLLDTVSGTFEAALPSFVCAERDIVVTNYAPRFGILQKALFFTCEIKNYSPDTLQLSVAVVASDDFFLSGRTRFHVRVLPHCSHSEIFNLIPKLCGELPLPQLEIDTKNFGIIDYPTA